MNVEFWVEDCLLKTQLHQIENSCFFVFKQLVYKVKANTILEKLASASVGSYGHEVWLDLVNEAKENLQKIQVWFFYFYPLIK